MPGGNWACVWCLSWRGDDRYWALEGEVGGLVVRYVESLQSKLEADKQEETKVS